MNLREQVAPQALLENVFENQELGEGGGVRFATRFGGKTSAASHFLEGPNPLHRPELCPKMLQNRMEKKLPQFLELLAQLHQSPLKALAKSLTSCLQPIVAMWRFTRNNGVTEGFHNKMEMISRRAYGFRNFENYRIRVMTHCGWDGVINRVR